MRDIKNIATSSNQKSAIRLKSSKKYHEDNSKKYWQYADSKLKTKSQVPHLKINETNYTSSKQEKVDILNDFFSSVFTKEDFSNQILIIMLC